MVAGGLHYLDEELISTCQLCVAMGNFLLMTSKVRCRRLLRLCLYSSSPTGYSHYVTAILASKK